ncbi:MAG: cbb3-type cytochrome c oxidase subunit 3 [Alcaligenaceae bacterium]|nr:cbb3-type cytochrome c oxidase subunit 3 [Alcaligenaceae bacterium]
MIGIVNGLMIILAMVTFLGIVWWAFSRGRAQANNEAAMLPFSLPDEGQAVKREGGSNE